MRIVLVHGINNQGRSEREIIDDWLNALSKVLPSNEIAAIRRSEIVAPFYGDVLFNATKEASTAGPIPIALSAGDLPNEEADFYLNTLEDMAPVAGVTETDIRKQAGTEEAIEQGLPHDRRLNAILRAVETVSPFQGKIMLRFIPQAFVYLRRPHVADQIDDIVRPALSGEPCIVIAHSLGTVVAFKLLRATTSARVPFYLTLGSPLAVKSVKNALGPAYTRPSNISTWINGLDRDDAVTVGRALKANTFGPGIENIDDIENGNADPHDIRRYLQDRRIAQAISKAVLHPSPVG